jgi:hypothetical protein
MKYFALVIVLFVVAVAYLRAEQPQIWNDLVSALKVAETSSSISSDIAAGPGENSLPPTNAVAAKRSDAPAIISPSSTNYINPDHVRPVEQPGEVPASTNTPSTNTPATNSPATNAAG